MLELVVNLLAVVGAIELVTHFLGNNKSATVELVTRAVEYLLTAIRKT